MKRAKRIRVVLVAGLGLVSLVVAFFIGPIMAIIYVPQFTSTDQGENIQNETVQFIQAVKFADNISLVALLIAVVCLLYLLSVSTIWFIGPKETPADPE